MKRIIFSSVCAVALFSVNANAATWADMIAENDKAYDTAYDSLYDKVGAAALSYNTKVDNLVSKQGALATARNSLNAAKENLANAKVTFGTTAKNLVGTVTYNGSATEGNVTNLSDLLKVYVDTHDPDQSVDNTEKIAEVKAAIEAANAGETITFTKVTGATEVAKLVTAYNDALTKINTTLPEAIDTEKQGVTNAESELRTAERELKAEEDKLIKAIDGKEDAAKLQSELKDLIAKQEKLEAVSRALANYEAQETKIKALETNLEKAKEVLGEADSKVGSSLYAVRNKANEAIEVAKRQLGAESDKADKNGSLYAKFAYAKDAVIGEKAADIPNKSGETLTQFKNLASIKAYFEKSNGRDDQGQPSNDAKYDNSRKVEAVNKAIEKLNKGEELVDGTELVAAGASGTPVAVTWADIKGGIADATVGAVKTAKDNVDKKKGEIGKPSNGDELATGLYQAYEVADYNVKSKEAERDTIESSITSAKSELNNLQALLNEAKLLTPVGSEQLESAKSTIAADLQGLAQDNIESIVKLIITNEGEVLKVADLRKSTSEADKTLLKEIQTLADNIASKALESKKDETVASSLGTLNVQINNMNKRLGEIRGLEGDVGTWFRAYGGKYSNDTASFNYYSTQIGADKINHLSNGEAIVGALFGFDKVNADVSSKTFSLGLYASYIDNDGFFADVVAKLGKTKHSKDGYDIKSQNIFLTSVEGGYRFNINDSNYVEPSLELITGHVGGYEAKAANTSIKVDSFTPFVVKPQVFYGFSADNLTFRIGGGAVINTKTPNASLSINNLIKDLNANANVKLDKNNYGFASVGGSYKFTDNLRLNLGVEKSFGGSLTQDYEVNATIRYTF